MSATEERDRPRIVAVGILPERAASAVRALRIRLPPRASEARERLAEPGLDAAGARVPAAGLHERAEEAHRPRLRLGCAPVLVEIDRLVRHDFGAFTRGPGRSLGGGSTARDGAAAPPVFEFTVELKTPLTRRATMSAIAATSTTAAPIRAHVERLLVADGDWVMVAVVKRVCDR